MITQLQQSMIKKLRIGLLLVLLPDATFADHGGVHQCGNRYYRHDKCPIPELPWYLSLIIIILLCFFSCMFGCHRTNQDQEAADQEVEQQSSAKSTTSDLERFHSRARAARAQLLSSSKQSIENGKCPEGGRYTLLFQFDNNNSATTSAEKPQPFVLTRDFRFVHKPSRVFWNIHAVPSTLSGSSSNNNNKGPQLEGVYTSNGKFFLHQKQPTELFCTGIWRHGNVWGQWFQADGTRGHFSSVAPPDDESAPVTEPENSNDELVQDIEMGLSNERNC